MNKPLILVTNDDSINAPGIRFIIQKMNEIGEVYVVAPDSSQSGASQAITTDKPLTIKPVFKDGPQKEWSCSGTPTDCVKIAIDKILPRKPDLCISGINHGANASTSVFYSGTMGAAIEAAMQGIPSIGFSILDFSWETSFKHIEEYISKITRGVLDNNSTKELVLNVNLPKYSENKPVKGAKICRQAKAFWKAKLDQRTNPQGKEYYWLGGEFENLDLEKDTDIWALENNYISIVPISLDLTAHHLIENLNTWNFE